MQGRIRWLYNELPALVARQVITEADAQRLRDHYGPAPTPLLPRLLFTLMAILGSLCIGAGIILLFAHNWEELSRPTRTALSFAPLVVGQLLTAWVLMRRRESAAWCEAVGAFTALAIGACIALIGQTYHLPGDMRGFLWTWMLLGAPLIYLLRCSSAALLYMAGVIGWSFARPWWDGSEPWFWPLTALLLPHLVWAWRRNPRSPRFLLLSGGCCLYLYISLASVLDHGLDGFWIVIYGSLVSLMALAGFAYGERAALGLVRLGGVAGVVVYSLVLSFSQSWNAFRPARSNPNLSLFEAHLVMDYATALALLVLVGLVVLQTCRKRDLMRLVWAGPALLSAFFFPLVAFGLPTPVAAIAFNLYLVGLGLVLMRAGARKERLGTLNLGMAIIGLIMVARFFDSEMGFTERGIAFLAAGALFLGGNLYLRRRMHRTRET